jgi:hypothetical protein
MKSSKTVMADIQDSQRRLDPLAVEQWYLADTKYYKKRSCLRTYLLGYRHKRQSKQVKNGLQISNLVKNEGVVIQ